MKLQQRLTRHIDKMREAENRTPLLENLSYLGRLERTSEVLWKAIDLLELHSGHLTDVELFLVDAKTFLEQVFPVYSDYLKRQRMLQEFVEAAKHLGYEGRSFSIAALVRAVGKSGNCTSRYNYYRKFLGGYSQEDALNISETIKIAHAAAFEARRVSPKRKAKKTKSIKEVVL